MLATGSRTATGRCRTSPCTRPRRARLTRATARLGPAGTSLDDAGRDERLRRRSGRHRGRHEQLLAGPRRRAAGSPTRFCTTALPLTPPRSAMSPSAATIPAERALPGHVRLRPGERHRRAAGRCAGRRPGRVRARATGVRSHPHLGPALRCPDASVRALHHAARRAQRCRGRHRRGPRHRPGRVGDRRSRVAANHRRPRRLVAAAAGAVAADALACRLPRVGDEAAGDLRPPHDIYVIPPLWARTRRVHSGPACRSRSRAARSRAGGPPGARTDPHRPAAAGIASGRPGWGRAAVSGG